MDSVCLRSKFLGGMVGSALGDALGELAFRLRSEQMLRTEATRRPILEYTDDTAMAIGLAESLSKMGTIDEQHLGDTFRANFEREPWRGYGAGPPIVFSLVEEHGVSYHDAARTLFGGHGSYGNGAAMRIAPIGLFFHDSEDLYRKARASASVTHTHPVGVDGAAVLALAVAQAVRLEPQESLPVNQFLEPLLEFARTPEIRDKLMLVGDLISRDVCPLQAAVTLGQGVAVHLSMPFAVYSFLCHSGSFRSCLFCAVLNGGDRDTLGAMACAISGAHLGIEGIPSAWRGRLENRERIEELALELAEGRDHQAGRDRVRAARSFDQSRGRSVTSCDRYLSSSIGRTIRIQGLPG
jgi:poly(ADP-ribose) glycohydrolase ARH3